MASSTSQRERITILLASSKGLSMKPVTKVFAAAAFPLAALGPPAAQAAGVEVLNEGFDNLGGTVGNWLPPWQAAPAGASHSATSAPPIP